MASEHQKLQLTREQSNVPKIFLTAYGPKRKASLRFPPDEGRTKQSFKDECDINVIMRRYQQTGVLEHVQKKVARYADVSGMDYQRALDVVADARTAFSELPAEIRDRFNNDPAQLLEFLQDEGNREEAMELGMLSPEAVEAWRRNEEQEQEQEVRAKPEGGQERQAKAEQGEEAHEVSQQPKKPSPAKPK